MTRMAEVELPSLLSQRELITSEDQILPSYTRLPSKFLLHDTLHALFLKVMYLNK